MQFDATNPNAQAWRKFFFALGLVIVLAGWAGTRVYLIFNFEPMHHAMTKVFKDIAVSLDEGHKFGEVNEMRLMRNLDFSSKEVYKTDRQPGDKYCAFKTLDPGLGGIYAAANKIMFFIPDTEMRIISIQLFLDALLVIFFYLTFYRWGWIPAVFGALLYASHSVFALSADAAWYHFWDGLVATLSVLLLLWIYRLQKDDRPKAMLITLAILLGLILGAGVWIRSSWFIFAPIMLGASAIFSKTLRPWLIYPAVIYVLFAGGMVMRATQLSGHLAYSTRMSWHTAFQALGHYPNQYALEDDDLYLFERSHQEDHINYNFCDYSQEDQVMKQKYQALWHDNPGYIVHSIAQRMFASIFGNFSDQNFVFWDHYILFAAWAGLMFGLWLGGDMQVLALLAAMMYVLINTAYSFVYYIHREYSYPTQMMNIFGSAVAVAGLCELVRRAIRRDWPKWDKDKIQPVNIGLLFSAIVAVVLFFPPVQQYFTPNPVITVRWDTPPVIMGKAFMKLHERIDALPPAVHARLIAFMKSHTENHISGPDDPVYQYVIQNLREASFTNLDGSGGEFWFNRKVDSDTYEPLARASQSIAGVGYAEISSFDVADPATWEGKQLRIKLVPNTLLSAQRVDELMIKKFDHWNWDLRALGNGEYIGAHVHDGCSETRLQLARYFNHQCGELNGQPIQSQP